MKLSTFEMNGKKQVGVMKEDGVVSLNRLLGKPQLSMMELVEKGLSYMKEIEPLIQTSESDYSLSEVELKAPLERPKKVVCVGNNYMDHCREQNVEPPKNPLIFSKWPSCVVGYDDDIVLPSESNQVDFEAELGVVFQNDGKYIAEENVVDHIFGYLALNDVSARDVQFSDGQWVRGKSYDTFIPTGPFIVTADEIEDPHNLSIKTTVNGQVLQDSNTKEMIFNINEIISYLSKGFTFEAGDLIATGTPHGVGVFRDPQLFLEDGDNVTIEIEQMGQLTNNCVREESSSRFSQKGGRQDASKK